MRVNDMKEQTAVCSNCGNGTGAKVVSKSNNALPVASIIASVVGSIGNWVFPAIVDFSTRSHFVVAQAFHLCIATGILLAAIALFKQRSKLALAAGLTPVAHMYISVISFLVNMAAWTWL